MFAAEIVNPCIKFSFLKNEQKVDSADTAAFHKLKYKEVKMEVKNSLKPLMRMMYDVYGKLILFQLWSI